MEEAFQLSTRVLKHFKHLLWMREVHDRISELGYLTTLVVNHLLEEEERLLDDCHLYEHWLDFQPPSLSIHPRVMRLRLSLDGVGHCLVMVVILLSLNYVVYCKQATFCVHLLMSLEFVVGHQERTLHEHLSHHEEVWMYFMRLLTQYWSRHRCCRYRWL